jgi:hypothetical protein
MIKGHPQFEFQRLPLRKEMDIALSFHSVSSMLSFLPTEHFLLEKTAFS